MTDIQDPLETYQEFPGPVLLFAGPGTGKTFQLAHRVKFLLDVHGATPEDIAVITFTSGMEPSEIISKGKQQQKVQARSLFCFWAVKELGVSPMCCTFPLINKKVD